MNEYRITKANRNVTFAGRSWHLPEGDFTAEQLAAWMNEQAGHHVAEVSPRGRLLDARRRLSDCGTDRADL